MLLILLVVFLAVFGLFVLVMMAAGGRSTPPETVRATLESVLLKAPRAGHEEVVDLRKNASLSSIPWIDRLLARVRPAADLRRILAQADIRWTPGRLLLTAAAAWIVAGYAIYFKTGAPSASALVASAAGAAPFFYVLHKRRRRFDRFLKALPDSIDLMVSALRAGNSTMGALGIVASQAPEPVRGEFRTCFDEQSYGVDLRAAMENLLARIPLPDLHIITTAILIQKESGGNLAEILDKTAHTIRDRFRLHDQIRVHTAHGRFTGWVLSILPLAMGIVLYFVYPQYIELLFTQPLGHKMMAGGAILNLIGLLMIRKIIRIQI
jgi:tight adherence protein B